MPPLPQFLIVRSVVFHVYTSSELEDGDGE